LITAVECTDDADQVARAVAEVSENLIVRRVLVQSVQRAEGGVTVGKEWILSVWVPPKAMLLVSSMIGEALSSVATDRPLMLLAEGLEFDGEPDYVCGDVGPEGVIAANLGEASSETSARALFADVARKVVEQRLAASAQLDKAAIRVSFRTTAAGRRALEQWLPLRGINATVVTWTPFGGSAEYLQWIAEKTANWDKERATLV